MPGQKINAFVYWGLFSIFGGGVSIAKGWLLGKPRPLPKGFNSAILLKQGKNTVLAIDFDRKGFAPEGKSRKRENLNGRFFSFGLKRY